MRINKFVAQASGLSRRAADDAIAKGRVTINDQPVELGSRVNSNDKVMLDGNQISLQNNVYLMLNKPTNYVCSKNSQGDSPTIYELLKPEHQDLKLAGRLDRDSSGLLLLSNDGDFLHQMMHPSNNKTKVYKVVLKHDLSDEWVEKIENGLQLDDGSSKLGLKGEGKSWTVTMEEGRNRQIRRTFVAANNEVVKLNRIELGPFKLNDLQIGDSAIVEKII